MNWVETFRPPATCKNTCIVSTQCHSCLERTITQLNDVVQRHKFLHFCHLLHLYLLTLALTSTNNRPNLPENTPHLRHDHQPSNNVYSNTIMRNKIIPQIPSAACASFNVTASWTLKLLLIFTAVTAI